MALKQFPRIDPSERTFTPGRLPERRFEAMNGAVTRLRYSNQFSQATLSLGFWALDDDQVMEILDFYEEVEVGSHQIRFTDDRGLAGARARLQQFIAAESEPMTWRFKSAPDVKTVKNWRHNVTCEFVAEIEAP